MDLNRRIEQLGLLAEQIGSLNSTVLQLIGGSIAVVMGTKLLSPGNARVRYIYLLLPFAWAALCASFYYGTEAMLIRADATLAARPEQMDEIVIKFNLAFDDQRLFFFIGVIFLALWLIGYMLWRILTENST